jgi:hypothetical protein
MTIQPKAQWGEVTVEPGVGGLPSARVPIAPVPDDEVESMHLERSLRAVGDQGLSVRSCQLEGNVLSLLMNADADVEAVKRAVDAVLDAYPASAERREHEAAARAANAATGQSQDAATAAQLQDRFRA